MSNNVNHFAIPLRTVNNNVVKEYRVIFKFGVQVIIKLKIEYEN